MSEFCLLESLMFFPLKTTLIQFDLSFLVLEEQFPFPITKWMYEVNFFCSILIYPILSTMDLVQEPFVLWHDLFFSDAEKLVESTNLDRFRKAFFEAAFTSNQFFFTSQFILFDSETDGWHGINSTGSFNSTANAAIK